MSDISNPIASSFQWPSTKRETDGISNDGSKIIFSVRNGCSFMRTSQPIPRSLKSFRWETKVIDGDNDFTIGIGFASGLPEVGKGFPQQIDSHMIGLDLYFGCLWRGMNKENIITEKPRNGDVIGCHLQYIEKDGHEYSICHFYRNGLQVGIFLIRTAEMYPIIWGGGRKVVETNLTGKSFTYPEGNDKIICNFLSY